MIRAIRAALTAAVLVALMTASVSASSQAEVKPAIWPPRPVAASVEATGVLEFLPLGTILPGRVYLVSSGVRLPLELPEPRGLVPFSDKKDATGSILKPFGLRVRVSGRFAKIDGRLGIEVSQINYLFPPVLTQNPDVTAARIAPPICPQFSSSTDAHAAPIPLPCPPPPRCPEIETGVGAAIVSPFCPPLPPPSTPADWVKATGSVVKIGDGVYLIANDVQVRLTGNIPPVSPIRPLSASGAETATTQSILPIDPLPVPPAPNPVPRRPDVLVRGNFEYARGEVAIRVSEWDYLVYPAAAGSAH